MSPASTPRFDPRSYPGPRPTGPVLVRGASARPLELGGPSPRPYLGPTAAAVPEVLAYSVAYGSNANVDRLWDKGLTGAGAVLLPARMRGWDPAFAARETRYGSVPLVLVPGAADRVRDTWVVGLAPEALAALDESEGRRPGQQDDAVPGAPTGGYLLGRIGPVAVADRYLLADALAYRPSPGTRLLAHGDGAMTWPEHDQAEARAALAGAGPTVPAPPVERVEAGAWPPTPLTDLPLFVYGTLQPGEAAWSQIADLVSVVGRTRAAGRLHATPYGWPAADLGARGAVHGTLLAARGPRSAVDLVARTDAYEGAPELFRRRAVPVERHDGSWTWAMAYHWAGELPPPGRPLPEGVWAR